MPDLIATKRAAEDSPGPNPALLERDVTRLNTDLEHAVDTSPLPGYADPAALDALHHLVVSARLTH